MLPTFETELYDVWICSGRSTARDRRGVLRCACAKVRKPYGPTIHPAFSDISHAWCQPDRSKSARGYGFCRGCHSDIRNLVLPVHSRPTSEHLTVGESLISTSRMNVIDFLDKEVDFSLLTYHRHNTSPTQDTSTSGSDGDCECLDSIGLQHYGASSTYHVPGMIPV